MTACLAMLHGENQICTIKFFIFMLFLISRNPVPHQPFHFTSREFITYSTIRWQSTNQVVRSPPCWSCLLKIGESLCSSEFRFAIASFDQSRRDSTLEASVEALVAPSSLKLESWHFLYELTMCIHECITLFTFMCMRASLGEYCPGNSVALFFLKLFLTLTWFIWYRLWWSSF